MKDPPNTPTVSLRPAPPPPEPTNATYLFNLANDPEERFDLSSERPDLVLAMVCCIVSNVDIFHTKTSGQMNFCNS